MEPHLDWLHERMADMYLRSFMHSKWGDVAAQMELSSVDNIYHYNITNPNSITGRIQQQNINGGHNSNQTKEFFYEQLVVQIAQFDHTEIPHLVRHGKPANILAALQSAELIKSLKKSGMSPQEFTTRVQFIDSFNC